MASATDNPRREGARTQARSGPPVGSDERRRADHIGPRRRRPMVLDAALELFAEHGYAGTSMNAIAAAAGVTKPVVYDCFPGKEALFEALLEREERLLMNAIAERLANERDTRDLERMISRGYTAVFEAAAERPAAWKLVFAGADRTGSETSHEARARRSIVQRLSMLIDQPLAELGVRNAQVKAVLMAELLASVAEGCMRQINENPETWKPEEMGPMLGRLIARGPTAI